jgi:hypothetical protein
VLNSCLKLRTANINILHHLYITLQFIRIQEEQQTSVVHGGYILEKSQETRTAIPEVKNLKEKWD